LLLRQPLIGCRKKTQAMIANAVYKFHTKKLEVKALTTAPTL